MAVQLSRKAPLINSMATQTRRRHTLSERFEQRERAAGANNVSSLLKIEKSGSLPTSFDPSRSRSLFHSRSPHPSFRPTPPLGWMSLCSRATHTHLSADVPIHCVFGSCVCVCVWEPLWGTTGVWMRGCACTPDYAYIWAGEPPDGWIVNSRKATHVGGIKHWKLSPGKRTSGQQSIYNATSCRAPFKFVVRSVDSGAELEIFQWGGQGQGNTTPPQKEASGCCTCFVPSRTKPITLTIKPG